MSWLILGIAIAVEVVATVLLKVSDGFSRVGPSVVVLALYVISTYLFAVALRGLELGLAYAVWAGVGTAAVAVIGVMAFSEPITALKTTFIALIIVGTVGLNWVSAGA